MSKSVSKTKSKNITKEKFTNLFKITSRQICRRYKNISKKSLQICRKLLIWRLFLDIFLDLDLDTILDMVHVTWMSTYYKKVLLFIIYNMLKKSIKHFNLHNYSIFGPLFFILIFYKMVFYLSDDPLETEPESIFPRDSGD